MSEEKQLTVAELLARAGRDADSGEKPKPRRRRRNLEEGGVSVAELTGSIPKVPAKPAEARHSSVPIDAETTPEKPGPAAGDDKAGSKADNAAPAKSGPPAPKAAPKSQPKPTPESAAKPASTAKPAPTSAAKPGAVDKSAAPAPKGEQKPKPKPAAESPVKPAAVQPGPTVKTKTGPQSGAEKPDSKREAEKAEKTAGPKSTPQPDPKAAEKPHKPQQTTAEPKPAAGQKVTSGKAAEEPVKSGGKTKPVTGVGPAAAAAAGPGAAVKDDAESEDRQPIRPSKDDTIVLNAIEDAAPDSSATAPHGTAAAEAAAVPAAKTTRAEQTGEIPAVDGAATDVVVADDADELEADTDEEEEGSSVGVVIGMAVIGIILGALVFLGFEQLWARLNWILVGIVALLVTAGMVVSTKLLRTASDGLSMTLAGIVGLIMTFGPLLIILL